MHEYWHKLITDYPELVGIKIHDLRQNECNVMCWFKRKKSQNLDHRKYLNKSLQRVPGQHVSRLYPRLVRDTKKIINTFKICQSVTAISWKLSAELNSGSPIEADGRQTEIWEKRDGKWLIIRVKKLVLILKKNLRLKCDWRLSLPPATKNIALWESHSYIWTH